MKKMGKGGLIHTPSNVGALGRKGGGKSPKMSRGK